MLQPLLAIGAVYSIVAASVVAAIAGNYNINQMFLLKINAIIP